ncbi:MFS transporter [Synechococcus sp. CS-1328]|uniref:MFS transporter n=1 Tax=Synechococcus sp. CS-1328 TaxID=2847976 RepID=UPI00223AB9AF|nr:MFS transporter [Synechococcus sp. CS-1328]MCT0224791.1 MFS transporter [Synechococcus sp. CS-1328]
MPPLIVLALAAGLSVANLFYSQSLLPQIATDLQLAQGQVVLAPMATQAGLALSLLLILPIGDGVNRRGMLILAALGTAAASAALALLPGFRLLLLAWFSLGLFALVPYLLPAYLSGLVPDAIRGRLLGTILSGHFGGILLSRSFSGVVAQSFGWRTVYLWACLVMLAVALLFRLLLPKEVPARSIHYWSMQRSQLDLLRRYPDLRRACLSQGLQFGAFMALWSALALHLAEPPWQFGPARIGGFGLVGLVSIAAAPWIGRLVDRRGAWTVVVLGTLTSLVGVLGLWLGGGSLGMILIALTCLDLGVQGCYVANQTLVFGLDLQARSRLGCLLFFSAYLAAALCSALVARFWSGWGWTGATVFSLALVTLALLLQRRPQGAAAMS